MNWQKIAADETERNALIEKFREHKIDLETFYRRMKRLESAQQPLSSDAIVDYAVITWDLSQRVNGRYPATKEPARGSLVQLAKLLDSGAFRRETGVPAAWKSPVKSEGGVKTQRRIILLAREYDSSVLPRLAVEIESLR